jgi:hypothetical protein
MNEQQSEKDIEVWQQLVESHNKFALASKAFLLGDIDRVSLMKQALYDQNRATAFYFLRYLKQEELIQLFDILVPLASTGHGSVSTVREAILSLPRDWVIKNIEQLAEPLLAAGTYDEYRRFLELYFELDKDLALKLAQRAVEHSDYDIKEVGEDYLEMLEQGR